MKLGSLCSAMATLALQAGPANTILVVALASRPKEDSSVDVLDRGAYYWGHKTFWTRGSFAAVDGKLKKKLFGVIQQNVFLTSKFF